MLLAIPSKTFGTSSSKYTRHGKSDIPNSSAIWKSWKYNYNTIMWITSITHTQL
jgi:hypothetical protein